MSNTIPPQALTPLHLYQRVSRPQRTAAAKPAAMPTTQPAMAPGKPTASGAALTASEQQAIDQLFPATPRMALRLYGPQQPSATTPATLGTRLDVRG